MRRTPRLLRTISVKKLPRVSPSQRGDLFELLTRILTVRINMLFKSLGCKIGKLTMQDLKRLGLPDSAGETKRAVLDVPLEFPKSWIKRRA